MKAASLLSLRRDTKKELACYLKTKPLLVQLLFCVPMQNGADDRRESKGIQGQAGQLAPQAVGADQSYYSTNGSSLSAHVAVLSVANFGDKILVTRNAHKSMIAALIMADVLPVFLEPAIDEEW